MFKKFLIGILISILLLVGCIGIVRKPLVIETCSVAAGETILVLRDSRGAQLVRAEPRKDINNLEILEPIPANVAAELSEAYPGDWSDSKLTRYMNVSEELLIIVRTEDLWNCK